MKQINSECGKFRVEIKNDDDSELQICRKITSSEGTKEYKVTKYRTIKIMNSENDNVIFEYKQYLSHPLDNFIFFKQNGTNWFLGSREYMSQIFVNLDTGEYYDNCSVDFLDDSGYVKHANVLKNKNGGFGSENHHEGFIWTEVKISECGNMALADGCYWACSYETKVYDISDIKNGWTELDVDVEYYDEYYDCITEKNGMVYCYKCDKELENLELEDVEISKFSKIPVVEFRFDNEKRELIDTEKYKKNAEKICEYYEKQHEERREQKNKKNIELYYSTNNIFKDILMGKTTTDLIVFNENDRSCELLNNDVITKISCFGKYSGNEYESHVIDFIKHVTLDDIIKKEENMKYIDVKRESYKNMGINVIVPGFEISDDTDKKYNRRLAEQICLLTCNRFDNIPKSMLQNIGIKFVFECIDDLKITICVEIFLEDGEKETRKLGENSEVKITIT